MTRQVTNRLIDLVDEGVFNCNDIMLACLGYMSEDDVNAMVRANDLLLALGEDDEHHV